MEGNILEFLEHKYAVEKLELSNGQKLWPLLRDKVYAIHLKKKMNYNSKKRSRKLTQLAKNFFYGWPNLFKLKKFEFLFFENTNKRILINERYYDIYFDAWADKLGRNSSLFIEFATLGYYPQNQVHSEFILSDLPFKLISSLFSRFGRPVVLNSSILKEIEEELGVQGVLLKEARRQYGEFSFYHFLFKKLNPKAVFVLSSFSKIAIVMAAKSRNIAVYEAQHGFIGESHPFYHISQKRFDESYPDYLFSFGSYEIRNNKNFIFEPERIIPIGGLQLEHLKANALPDALKALRDDYKYIFCLTMQSMMEEELIRSTITFADQNPESLFIICPRNRDSDYSEFLRRPNYLLSEYSIYDVLKIADFNITIFSTTAVEGDLMGARTIFYNAKNLSKKYFNLDEIKAAVIEEGEDLNSAHLAQMSPGGKPYYIEGYFENVERHKFEL